MPTPSLRLPYLKEITQILLFDNNNNISCHLNVLRPDGPWDFREPKIYGQYVIFSIRIESVNCPYIFTSVPDPMIYGLLLFIYAYWKAKVDTPPALDKTDNYF